MADGIGEEKEGDWVTDGKEWLLKDSQKIAPAKAALGHMALSYMFGA